MRHVVIALLVIALLTAAVTSVEEDPLTTLDHPSRRKQSHGGDEEPQQQRHRHLLHRSLLFQGESLKQAHQRERAKVDAIPTDEVGVDEFEAEWSDPSWQAGGTGGTAHVTHTGCASSIVEWNHAASQPIWNDAPGRDGASLASGNVTTAAGGCLGGFADGYAAKSRFRHPADVAVAPDGAVLYVADAANRSDAGAMGVRTIAGSTTAHAPMGGYRDGPGAMALFRNPAGLAVVRDTGTHTRGAEGQEPVSEESVEWRRGSVRYPNFGRVKGNVLYVADSTDNRVRRVVLSGNGMASREVTTLVGGGTETELEQERRAREGTPQHSGVTWPAAPTTAGGGGAGVTGVLAGVLASERDKRRGGGRRKRKKGGRGGETAGEAQRIGKGGGGEAVEDEKGPPGIGSTDLGARRYVSHGGHTPPGLGGHVDGSAAYALLRRPRGLAADPEGRTLYVADSGNNAIRAVALLPLPSPGGWGKSGDGKNKNGEPQVAGGVGTVTTLAGAPPPERPDHKDGAYDETRFHNPSGVVVSPDGHFLYVADTGNHRVRRIDLRYRSLMRDKKDAVVTVAGTGRPGSQDGAALTSAQLHDPWGLAIHPDGDLLFISEAGGRVVRTLTLDPAGSPNSGARHVLSTLTGRECHRHSGGAGMRLGLMVLSGAGVGARAGAGAGGSWGVSANGGVNNGAPVDGPAHAACLAMPMGCSLSPRGGALYVADSGAERIRRVAAMTPTEIRAATAVFAPPPLAPGTPCYCVTVARIYVGSGVTSGTTAADGGGPVVDRTQTSYFYKSSTFTVVVELDRYTPDFPLNALKVVKGGKVLSAAAVGMGGAGNRDNNARPRYSYLVQAEGRVPVHLRVGTMRRVSAEGKIESGWEGEPERGIEVLPHPSLGTTPVGVARDYLLDPSIVGMATSFLAFAGLAAGAAAGLVGAWRRFAAHRAKRRHAVMMGDVFGAVEDWRTGRLTVQMVNHKGL